MLWPSLLSRHFTAGRAWWACAVAPLTVVPFSFASFSFGQAKENEDTKAYGTSEPQVIVYACKVTYYTTGILIIFSLSLLCEDYEQNTTRGRVGTDM